METPEKVEVKHGAPEAAKVFELGHVSEETKGLHGKQIEGSPPRPFGQM